MTDFEKVRRFYINNIVASLGIGLANALIQTHVLISCLLICLTGLIVLLSSNILKNPLRQVTPEQRKLLLAPYKISAFIYILCLAACLFIIWICMERGVRAFAIFNYVIATFLLSCAAFNGFYVLRMKPAAETP